MMAFSCLKSGKILMGEISSDWHTHVLIFVWNRVIIAGMFFAWDDQMVIARV